MKMAKTNTFLILIPCLIFLSVSHGQEAESDLPSPRMRCPEGSIFYGSHCYYYNYLDQLTWADADIYCQSFESGHLVSVLNQSEGNFVASLINDSGVRNSFIWIGFYDPKKNRRWHWSNSSPVTYKAWASGSPNNNNPGYCAVLASNEGYKKWKDLSCEQTYSFVCKFKG
ncbi:lithostathine-1-like [Dipodomys merriami]|uniref:lithostathine-1-like n=1 Tax=Dipodomys merriami TaxID=94247 RepID=UPI003855F3B2